MKEEVATRYPKWGYLQVRNFIKENPLILLIYVVSTSLVLLNHYWYIPWDFSAYVLNAKWLFYSGDYFELYRAPLTSLLIAPFLFLGRVSEYGYILAVTLFFLYANVKLSRVLFHENRSMSKRDFSLVFYFFSLNTFVITYSFHTGSELLCLAFLELFLSRFLQGKSSGHLLGLAFLTRYNALYFFPLLFIRRTGKAIVRDVVYFIITLLPWLIYNRIRFGNFLASFIDSYTLNVFSRDYLFESTTIKHFLPLSNWLIIFGIIGAVYYGYEFFTKKASKNTYKGIILILFACLLLWEFTSIPLKFSRYLFNLSLVIAYFSTIGLSIIFSRFPKLRMHTLVALTIIFLWLTIGLAITQCSYQEKSLPFKEASKTLSSIVDPNCTVLSPHWVPLNYLNGNVRPLGRNDMNGSIQWGNVIILFLKEDTIDDTFSKESLEHYPVLYSNQEYIIFGNNNLISPRCTKLTPYFQRFAPEPCFIIGETFSKFKLKELSIKLCNTLNFN